MRQDSFFSEGLKRAQAGLRTANDRSPTSDAAVLARAVTAGAVAGAYAGAVAGASAAAASVQRERQAASPQKPVSSPATLDAAARDGWQRALDERTGAWYYWHTVTRETTWTPPPAWAMPSAAAGVPAADRALELAQTVTLEEYVHQSGFAESVGAIGTPAQPQCAREAPSLYARDTDIDTEEEVRPSTRCNSRAVRWRLRSLLRANRWTRASEWRWRR